jgi:hypothetical protein
MSLNNKVIKRSCTYTKQAITLDAHHTNKLKEFQAEKDSLDELLKEADEFRCKLSNSNSNSIRDIRYLKDLEQKIEDIKTNKAEIDYYAEASDILFKYYDGVENENKCEVKRTILSFFDNKKPVERKNVNSNNQRGDLLDKYLLHTDKNYIDHRVKQIPIEFCEKCNENSMTVFSNEGMVYCNKCYTINNIITDNDKPSYKEPPKEISYFAYARINHFVEWLNNIQGKETTTIPQGVFDVVHMELKKNRVTDLRNVSKDQIKSILKKHKDHSELKLSKYYEHVPYIWNRITGNPNPHMSPQLEEKLKNMFRDLQVPYVKHSPKKRKNFCSYSFCLYKLLQVLGETEYLKYFTLLKSREKLHQQEQVWAKMCNELGWKYIRSI